MAGNRLVNYLTNSYQQGGIVEKQKALAMSPESQALGEQYQAEIDRDWGPEDIMSMLQGAGRGAKDIASYAPSMFPGGTLISNILKMLNPTAHDAIDAVIEENKIIERDQTWHSDFLAQPNILGIMKGIYNQKQGIKEHGLEGKVVEEDEYIDAEGNIVRPLRQPEHGNYGPVQLLP